MKTSDFDFPLPEALIAKEPAPQRDASRLMVLDKNGRVEHRMFHDLLEYLVPGDMLVLNRTKVLPLRLRGRKPTGGALEFLLVRETSKNSWEILSKGSYTGLLEVSDRLTAHVKNGRSARLEYDGDLGEILWEIGQMPLPPYIKRAPHEVDKVRYQTVYARDEGSIAAPTAGLHFTGEILSRLEENGVLVRYLTLHVGRGTFMPVRSDRTGDHQMEAEHFEVEKDLLREIGGHKGRVIAVGTTTTRTLEGIAGGRYLEAAPANSNLGGSTDIFISPGYSFRVVSGLLTNFHLPRSTPLMLAAALAGREKLLGAYASAVKANYRFFSYGDAMLIL